MNAKIFTILMIAVAGYMTFGGLVFSSHEANNETKLRDKGIRFT